MSLIETIAGFVLPQAAVSLRLLARAKKAATWLLAHPMTALALVAGVFGAVERHQAGHWEVIARQRGIALATVKSANARAIQQATAAKEQKDAFNAKLAATSDRTAADLRDRYHTAVLQLAAAQDRARRTDLPGDAEAAASSNRSGEGAGISARSQASATDIIEPLVIGQDDALTCADNTARLQAVHDWAAALDQ